VLLTSIVTGEGKGGDHWKRSNPRVYKKMVKNGDPERESEAAAKLTMGEMERHLFIFRSSGARKHWSSVST
jgi:hypothetical protein